MAEWEYCIVTQRHEITSGNDTNHLNISITAVRATLDGRDTLVIYESTLDDPFAFNAYEYEVALYRYIARLGASEWELVNVVEKVMHFSSISSTKIETNYYFKRLRVEEPTVQKPKRTRKPKAGKTE